MPCMNRHGEGIGSTGKQARERKHYGGNKKVASIYHGTNTSVVLPSDTIQITVSRWEGMKPSPSGDTFRYTGRHGKLPCLSPYTF